jgi:ATP-dependent exoDNAse (exonuclease V) alpha subunit
MEKIHNRYRNLKVELETGTHHLVIDGPAGSGKTTLIREFIKATRRKVIVTATTGLAASHINGFTIHSVFGFEPTLVIPDLIGYDRTVAKALIQCDTILIDEVSMLVCSTLDGIDRRLRAVRGIDRPFGGVRMIFVGDHCQLGPVSREFERTFLEQLSENYRAPYFYFQSAVFGEKEFLSNLRMCVLDGNFRHQSDLQFKATLDQLRHGIVTDFGLALINRRASDIFEASGPMICMTNRQVDSYNMVATLSSPNPKYTNFPEPLGVMTATDIAVREHPAIEPVILFEGAQVICTANNKELGYQNGSRGVITGIRLASKNYVSSIIVRLEQGPEVEITRHPFEVLRPFYNEITDRIQTMKVLEILNFPVRLAYAFTCHKAQGMTLSSAIIDRERGAPFKGQMYTAVSRVTSLNRLFLANELKAEDFKVEPAVGAFLVDMMTKIIPVA